MLTPAKVIFVIICAALAGLIFFIQAIDVLAVRNAPVVTGHIVARTPTRQYSVPRVDFTIRIDGTDTEVHAHAQRDLMPKVPDVVRFHYSGDPKRLVFLFEYDENPCWIFLFCWGVALFLTICLKSARIRQTLGWDTKDVHDPAA